MRLACWFALVLVSFPTFVGSRQAPKEAQEGTKPARLTSAEVSRLREQADTGDAGAQTILGRAYQDGNGVPKNPAVAIQWYQKAAQQGNATAENDLGIMYSGGEGVPPDKKEALRWFAKGAKHGNSQAMFNLGTCYYNGDGVDENDFTAYVWFLLGQDAGNPIADAAAERSAATKAGEPSNAYQRISEMYEKGDELPKDDAQALRWLQKAAKEGPGAKVVLAMHWLNGPNAAQHYSEAFELCKAAAAVNWVNPPAVNCVAQMYRKGLGVSKDPAEAVKWYQKAARLNAQATHELAQMYAAGEGTKIDRPEALMMYLQAGLMGMKTSLNEAVTLWQDMDASEQKRAATKMRERRLDPDKVIAILQAQPKS